MKVLFSNTSETLGGAAIAAGRIRRALEKKGVDTAVVSRRHKGAAFYLERLQIFLRNGFSRENLFAVSTASFGSGIVRTKAFREADIIHLHWINQGYLNLRELEAVFKSGKPVVWTMHDMWPFTGICHHSRECYRYSEGCGNCSFLGTSAGKNDISSSVFARKLSAYRNADITFVACSGWLRERAALSPLTDGHILVSIPNPIDTGFFLPSDKTEARRLLSLPQNRKYIMFGAARTSDPRKGIEYFRRACRILRDFRTDVDVIAFGQDSETLKGSIPQEVHSFGYIRDTETMRNLYRAADLFAIPSLEENLPNSIMEAMACGTPCVGFNVGGIPEMIDHGVNGYVARYESAEDFANGMSVVLSDEGFAAECREKILSSYSEERVSAQYLELYSELLKRREAGLKALPDL